MGVFLDRTLTFNAHIVHIITKFNLAIKMLYPVIINRKSELTTYNKITIVKTVFQAIALYACPVWGFCAKTHINRIQICQNKLLKMVMRLPWHYSTRRLHNLCNVEYILNRIHFITDKFQAHCNSSSNNYISSLYT